MAEAFDHHVREQLAFYELATNAVAHFGRQYIPNGGGVYDIGASTGNIGLALRDTLRQRQARFRAIEESQEMAGCYQEPPELVVADAVGFDFEPFDSAVCLLVLMFLPVDTRGEFLHRLQTLTKPGGALVIVDKVLMPAGYLTVPLLRASAGDARVVGAHLRTTRTRVGAQTCPHWRSVTSAGTAYVSRAAQACSRGHVNW